MIGTTVGHYMITSKLDIGSLGEAWLAKDTTLNRSVALKILPASLAQEETTRKRFLQEARTAGSLEHPNIASVHEVGELEDGRIWVAMSWSGGASLREKEKAGPLPAEEAVGIAIQIGRGLGKAHEAGVVHRDVTPENVVVGEDGRVKIVDFAVAKLAGSERLTRAGVRTGTVAYMSPEQAAGKEVDARSDIWALGVVLYEMLSGSHPFEGADENEVITKVLRADVKDTSRKVPWEVGRIIGKALEREAGDRYASVSEMVGELEWAQGKVTSGTLSKRVGVVVPGVRRKRRVRAAVISAVAAVVLVGAGVGGYLLWRARSAAPTATERVTIVLLPIVNGAGLSADDMLGEVMTDGLMTDLTKIRGFRVISQSSAQQIRAEETIGQVGKKLGVDYVLKGSAGMDGEKVLLSVALWKVAGEKKSWEKTYTKAATGMDALEAEVAQEAARQAGVRVTADDRGRLAKKKMVKPEAYELYLKAEKLADVGGNRDRFVKSMGHLSRVVELDPEWAEAWALLARTYWAAGDMGWSGPENRAKGDQALKRALELDPASAEVLTAAAISSFRSNQFSETRSEYDAALAANPSYVEALVDDVYLLCMFKRFDEALAKAEEAVRIDPLSERANMMLYLVPLYARHFADAVRKAREALELYPNEPFEMLNYGQTLVEVGRYDEAVYYANKSVDLGVGRWGEAMLGYALARKGDYQKARAIAEKLAREWDPTIPDDAMHVAYVYANTHDEKLAIEWLEKARKAGSSLNAGAALNIDPGWYALRLVPEFREIIRSLGLPE